LKIKIITRDSGESTFPFFIHIIIHKACLIPEGDVNKKKLPQTNEADL
jgi:hypothetical protein